MVVLFNWRLMVSVRREVIGLNILLELVVLLMFITIQEIQIMILLLALQLISTI
jgi:hypothetical protein